jgi:hypothetical protein
MNITIKKIVLSLALRLVSMYSQNCETRYYFNFGVLLYRHIHYSWKTVFIDFVTNCSDRQPCCLRLVVSNTYCVVFLFCISWYCVLSVASSDKYLKPYAVFHLYKAVIRTNGRRLLNSSDLTMCVRFQIDDIN